MFKRIFALVLAAASLLILVNSSHQSDKPEGRMLLHVRQLGDAFVFESVSVEPGAEPLPGVDDGGTFTFRDVDGNIVATRPALVRNRIFHDHSAGPDGKLEGYSKAVTDSFFVSVPYYGSAPVIECSFPHGSGEVRGDLRRNIPRSGPAYKWGETY